MRRGLLDLFRDCWNSKSGMIRPARPSMRICPALVRYSSSGRCGSEIEPIALGGHDMPVEFQSYRPELARITRQECAFGRWELASRGPHPQLRDYVIGYVGLRSTMHLSGERHLPSGEAALVVNLGVPHDVVGFGAHGGALKFHSAAAMGVHDRPFVTRSAGAKHLLVVRLTPPGARLLFDVAMDQLLNRWIDLEEMDRELARRIEGQVHERLGWKDLIHLMDSVIAERLAAARISAPGVLGAWRELRRSGGLTSMDSLVDHLGWSHKRLLA